MVEASKRLAKQEEARLSRVCMGQNVDNFGELVSQPFERQIVEELPPPQQPSIGIAQFRLTADRFPVLPYDSDLMLHDR